MCEDKCPKCTQYLYYDWHDNKDATHYCSKCKIAIILVFNASIRKWQQQNVRTADMNYGQD